MRFTTGLICYAVFGAATVVSAQKTAASADLTVYPRARVVQLPVGSNKNGITFGTSQAVFNQLDSITGTLSMTNQINHFTASQYFANQIV